MPAQTAEQLANLIDWQFTVTEQGHQARYGTLNGRFYKQFLPAGISVPGRHPPHPILERLYELALERAEG